MVGIKNKSEFRAQCALYLSLKKRNDNAGRATWTKTMVQMTRIGDALVYYAITMIEKGRTDYKTASDAMPSEHLRDKLLTALLYKGYKARDLLA